MNFSRLLLIPMFCLLASPLVQASEEGHGEKRPGMFSRLLHVFKKSDAGKEGKPQTWKSLVLSMSYDPNPLKLAETRQVKVTLQLTNKGKRLAQLNFPTGQRIEVLVRNKDGKLVEQWSEDQSFSNDPSMVSINPGERLEYTVSVATRDLVAGESYTIEAFFPNYEPLKVQTTLVPEK